MNGLPKIDMIEATRLTREGRLQEAMAVLRGERPDAFSPGSPSPRGDAGPSPAADAPRILDMVPPSMGTGDSWTSPQAGETPAADRPEGMSRRQTPEAVRGFLDRMCSFRPLVDPADRPGRQESVPRSPCRTGRYSRSAPMPTRREAGATSSTSQAALTDKRCLLW